MADRFTPEKRSEIMSRIRGRNTKPERLVRACLRHLGCRFRGNVKAIAGTPDFRLLGQKKLIFVHGCFWHGHKGCKRALLPESNSEFWQKKISRNIERDWSLIRRLRSSGWETMTIWQCQTRNSVALSKRISNYIER